MIDKANPAIYVACLAAYNNGYLHGKWIDATQTKDEIYQQIQVVLTSSPIPNAEEWAIHDYENFGSLRIEEYSDIDSVCKKIEFIQKHGELGTLLAEHFGSDDLEYAENTLNDCYHGEWDSETDFATELFNEIYSHNIPDNLLFYINYEQFSDDIFINDYLSIKHNGKVHIFSNS